MSLLIPRNLPELDEILHFAQSFPDIDPPAAHAHLTLLRVSAAAGVFFEQLFSEHSLSGGRFTVMILLYRASKGKETRVVSPADLAEAAGVTRATISGLLERLEKDGYITRSARKDDRRMIAVGLTSLGENLLEEVLPLHFKRVALVYNTLSKSEQKQLVHLLGKVNEGILNAG